MANWIIERSIFLRGTCVAGNTWMATENWKRCRDATVSRWNNLFNIKFMSGHDKYLGRWTAGVCWVLGGAEGRGPAVVYLRKHVNPLIRGEVYHKIIIREYRARDVVFWWKTYPSCGVLRKYLIKCGRESSKRRPRPTQAPAPATNNKAPRQNGTSRRRSRSLNWTDGKVHPGDI